MRMRILLCLLLFSFVQANYARQLKGEHYRVLSEGLQAGQEIDQDSSPEEIQAAYKRLIKIHFPTLNRLDHDRQNTEYRKAEEKVKALNNARDTLTDPDKKAKYDSDFTSWNEVTYDPHQERQDGIESVLNAIFQDSKITPQNYDILDKDFQALATYRNEILKNPNFEHDFKTRNLTQMINFLAERSRLYLEKYRKASDPVEVYNLRKALRDWHPILNAHNFRGSGMSPEVLRNFNEKLKGINATYLGFFAKNETTLTFLDILNSSSKSDGKRIFSDVIYEADNFHPEITLRSSGTPPTRIGDNSVYPMLNKSLTALFNDPYFSRADDNYRKNVLASAVKLLDFEAKRYLSVLKKDPRTKKELHPATWTDEMLKIANLKTTK